MNDMSRFIFPRMVNDSNQLQTSDNLLVIMMLESLPAEFDQFKINYNSLNKELSVAEISPQIVDKEERIKRQSKYNPFHVGSLQKKTWCIRFF